ncbi:MAG: glycosyltransferase family 39 protein, partial [Patescibacteria group bacterium]
MKKFLLPLFVCIHVFLLFNFKFTDWPEMLAYPYLLSRGFHFYGEIVHPYLPLLPYIILGMAYITGFSVLTLQLVTSFVIIVSDILLWKIAREWFSEKSAILTVIIYALISLAFDINGLWFDVFLVPFLISAWYLYWHYLRSNCTKFLYWSGFILGFSFLIKQTSVVYVVIIVAYELYRKTFKPAFFTTLIFTLPLLGVLVIFPFAEVWQWGIVFPLTAIGQMPGYIQYPTIRQLFIILIFLSPTLIWHNLRDSRIRLLGVWFIASLLFLFPRFDYFHLQPLIPFFTLGSMLVFTKIKKPTFMYLSAIVYLVIVGSWSIKRLSISFNQPP